MFKPFLIFTNIVLTSLIYAHATPYLCKNVLLDTKEAINISSIRLKFYLDPFETNQLWDISEKSLKAPHPDLSWQENAFLVYQRARVKNLNLTAEEESYINELKPEEGPFKALHNKISLPGDLSHSILAWLLAVHELEHRVQIIELLSTGLDENYVNLIMLLKTYTNEADAMRAEYEFAKALAPKAQRKLLQQLEQLKSLVNDNDDIKQKIPLIPRIYDLSVSDYIAENHRHGIYSSLASKSHIKDSITQSISFTQNTYTEQEQAIAKSFEGEFRIPKSPIDYAFDFFTSTLNSMSPLPLKIEKLSEDSRATLIRVSVIK